MAAARCPRDCPSHRGHLGDRRARGALTAAIARRCSGSGRRIGHRRARLPARPVPQRGLRDVGQLLVLGPPRLRHVLVALLPARRRRSGSGCSRRSRSPSRRSRSRCSSTGRPRRAHVRVSSGASYALSGAYPFMLGVAFALLALLALRALVVAVRRRSPCSRGARARSRCCCSRSSSSELRRWRAAAFCARARRAAGRARAPLPRPRPLPVPVVGVDRGARLRRRRLHRHARTGSCAASSAPISRSCCSRSRSSRSSARTRRGCGSWRCRSRCSPCAFRPLWVAVPLVALCAAYNLTPLAWSYDKGTRRESRDNRAYWAPAIGVPARAPRPELPRQRARHRRPLGGGATCPRPASRSRAAGTGRTTSPRTTILYSDDLNRRSYVALAARSAACATCSCRAGGSTTAPSASAPSRARCRSSRGAATSRSTRRRGRVRSCPGADVVRMTHEAVTIRVPARRPLHARDPRARDVRRAARRDLPLDFS